MIIGICGLIGSGKGTVADILVEHYRFQKLSFADSLKDGVAAMFGWPREMLEGDSIQSREWRESEDQFWTQELGTRITPRLVLQQVGTECMRQGFYDGIWISLVKQKLQKNPAANTVIPDVRFPNEISMIQQQGGAIWEVARGELPEWAQNYRHSGIEPLDIHASEWAWMQTPSDCVISNNSTLEDLRNQVSSLLAAI